MKHSDKGWLTTIKNLLKPNEHQSKQKQMLIYTVCILMLGILFMFVGHFSDQTVTNNESISVLNSKKAEEPASPVLGKESSNPETMIEYERRFENQLRDILEGIIGVDEVTVMINLDASEMKVFEKDIVTQSQRTDEKDREGGTRKVEDQSKEEKVVIIRNGDQEQPIIVKTMKPKVRGVLVVAEGAENIKIKKMVMDAVTKVLDVPLHRVSVLPKKMEEES